MWVVLAGSLTNADGQIYPLMFAFVFVLMTIGELMLSPVGMSATTKLAPQVFASQTMGLYFLAPALGQGVGAQVVKLYEPGNQQVYFGVIGIATIACGLLLWVASRWIKRSMHGVL